MRRTLKLCVGLLGLSAVLSVGLAVAPVANAPRDPAVVRLRVAGSWRSPLESVDAASWSVDTYNLDGTRITDYFAIVAGMERFYPDLTEFGEWRLVHGSLQIGKRDTTGQFQATELPRSLQWDRNGSLISIEGWTRCDTPDF